MAQTTDKRTHSAAPWFVSPESAGRWDVYSRGKDGSFPVASCVKETDARLIVEAPALVFELACTGDELADARRIIAEFSRETGQYQSDLAVFDAQLESARAVVKRARGEK